MQASANIGRSLGGALASIGETIGTSLEKYRKNKEEDQFLTGQAEAIVPSLQAYAGDIKDDKQKASYEGLIKKLGDFSGQSLSQKRATLAQAGTLVQSYKNAREAKISAMQLNAAQQALTNQEAYTQSLGGPTTRDVSREVPMSGLIDQSRYLYNAGQNQPPATQPDFASIQAMNANAPQPSSAPIQAPQPAPIATSANQATAGQVSNAPTTAFGNQTFRDTNTYPNRPDNLLSRVSENLAYGAVDSLMDANAAVKWLAKTSGYTGAVIKASGIADKLANVNYSPNNPSRREDILAAFSGSPQPSAENISAMSAQSPAAGPSPVPASVQAQAPQIAQAQPAAARRPALPSALQFEQTFNQGIGDLPAQTSKRTVIDKVDLTPKELYTNQLTSYIAKGGRLTPELNAQFKKDAGVFAPVDINVKQITNSDGRIIATAVISNGKLDQWVLPEKPIGAQSEIGKKITDMTNFLGQGNVRAAQLIADELKQGSSKMTEGQGKAYQYASELFKTNETISKLEANGFNPTNNTWDRFAPNFFKSDQGKQYYSAMDKWIEATLRDRSGATIMDSEYDKARSQYFPAYGDSEINIANKKALRSVAMQAMADRAEGKMNDRYFGAIGEVGSSGNNSSVKRFSTTGKQY